MENHAALMFGRIENERVVMEKRAEILRENSKKCKKLAINRFKLAAYLIKRRRKAILSVSLEGSLLFRTKERNIWKKFCSGSYWEKDVQTIDNMKFKQEFRVSCSTFEFIVEKMGNLKRCDTPYRLAIPLEKRIGVALYALGSSAEYRTIANLFGIGRTTVGELVLEFCIEVINQFEKQFISAYPPTPEKIEEMVNGFYNTWGFPQIYGAVDGCHIEVCPPKVDCTDYYNYKGWYSTVLLAAVDYRYRFTYINVGSPGRNNDSFIFENSQLKLQHENNDLFSLMSKNLDGIDVPVMLLGDSAFRLSKYLMKPYPHANITNRKQKYYNFMLSRTRRVVENAFGHLKARFRRLLKGMENEIHNTSLIIRACCILHNMCNELNDQIPPTWLSEINHHLRRSEPETNTNAGEYSQTPRAQREHITNFLWNLNHGNINA